MNWYAVIEALETTATGEARQLAMMAEDNACVWANALRQGLINIKDNKDDSR